MARMHEKNMGRLVKSVSNTFLTPVGLFISFFHTNEYYVEAVNAEKDKNRENFPNPNFEFHSEPLMLVNIKGLIIL